MNGTLIAEGCAAQFETKGGLAYTIWVSTDAQDDRACSIRVVPQDEPRRTVRDLNGLTARENEVAQLVVEGYTNSEIADELCISLSTVKCHMQKIFKKIGVANRTMLSKYCLAKSA